MKKQLVKNVLIAVAGIGLLAGSAIAAPIDGTLQMVGLFTPVDGTNTQVAIGSATGIDFTGWAGNLTDNSMLINDATGDFSVLVPSLGTMTDFQFASFVGPVNSLWTAGNFSYDLTGLSVTTHDATSIVLAGTGMMHGVGFDDTPGDWVASFQAIGTAIRYSWSASVDTVPIPEPATMLLFGTGIAGLAAIARRKIN